MIELWMTVVGLTMALSGIPQIIKLHQRKSSKDLSLSLWIILVHGQAWWLWYGFVVKSQSIIITNLVCVVIAIILLVMIIKYRKRDS